MKMTPLHQALGLVVLTAVYYFTGRLGLGLAVINPSASAVWAPTGIALAAFLIAGTRVWPAIFLGAFLVNITTSGHWIASLAIACGNTFEGIIGAMLVERFANGRHAFNHANGVVKFILFGALMATMTSASIGTLALAATGAARWADGPAIWATWWLGDATGALVVGSVLILASQSPRLTWNRWQAFNTALVYLGFCIAGVLAFSTLSPVGIYDYPLFLMVIPLVLVAAFRLRPPETAGAILLLSIIAIWGTMEGLGPFARYEKNTALLLLQIFMALTTMIGLIVAAEVHDRRMAEEALSQREQLYHLVIESATDAIVTIDEASVITYANGATQRMFGYTLKELLGRELTLLMPPRLRMPHLTGMVRYLASGQRTQPWQGREVIGLHKDGREFPIEISYGEHKNDRRLLTGVIRDISERHRVESARRMLATIVANSNDAVVGKDLDGKVLTWNQAAERIYGYRAEEIIGRPVSILIPPERQNENITIMERLRRGETIDHFETERIRKDGSRIHISLTISPIDDGSGHIIGASSVARDITERKKADAQIHYLAHHDPLTGLPNRMYFREHLSATLRQAAAGNYKVAVLFIDLDRFKEINDTLGHDIGDELLRIVAQRLRQSQRSGDLAARLGGDEFVILLPGEISAPEAFSVGEKVLALLREPLTLHNHQLKISASIGVGLFPDNGADENALMRCADEAMYRAKRVGRGNCQACNSGTGEDLPNLSTPQHQNKPRGPSGPHTPPRRPTGVHTLPDQPRQDEIRFE